MLKKTFDILCMLTTKNWVFTEKPNVCASVKTWTQKIHLTLLEKCCKIIMYE